MSYVKEILTQVAQGNELAYKQVWNQHHKGIYKFALRFLHDRDEAHEATQDVFMALWISKEHLVNVENFDDYLFIIKRNVVTRRLRDIAKKALAESGYLTVALKYQENADFRIRDKQLMAAYHRAIDALPPQQRKVYELANEMDMTYDEIAVNLNISTNTVKFHLKEVYKVLKHRLKPFSSTLFLFVLNFLF
jgi:RNA polymerase sigma-70 factor (ECF subfamily)